MVHHGIELPADLPIQGSNVFIEQDFIQALDFLRRLPEQFQKYTDGRRHSLIGRHFGQCLGILKYFDTT
ncbi:hypothetical protein D3C73_1411990 [compost metagenome]